MFIDAWCLFLIVLFSSSFRAEARAPPTPEGPLSFVPLAWSALPQQGDAPSPRICAAMAVVGGQGGSQWVVVFGALMQLTLL